MTDFTITLNLRRSDQQEQFCVHRADNGYLLKIRLRDGAHTCRLDGMSAALTAKKPDGALVYQDCTLEDGVFQTPITTQLTAIPGKVDCEVRIFDEAGQLFTSGRFLLDVVDTLYHDGDEIEAPSRPTRVLMAPYDCRVGQYFKIAEVNADGTAVRVEATDSPGGGYYTPRFSLNETGGVDLTFDKSESWMADLPVTTIPMPESVPGPQGPPGEQGPQGEQGIPGEPGEKGDPGEKGEKGDKGDPGPAGPQGEEGPAGPQGIPGEKGDKGDPGEKGDRGDPGEKGEKGDPGEKGADGTVSFAALTQEQKDSLKGEPGPAGPQGIPGEKGEKGDPGQQGIPGPEGAQGIPGEKGEPGSPGIYYGETQPTEESHPVWIDPTGQVDTFGYVTSVCGITPDENGNVPLTAADVHALPTSGGTMTGEIRMNGQPISGLNAPTEDTQAANKAYVDTNKVDKANVVNNFTTTEEGYVADARALKVLNDSKLSMELLWKNASPTSEFSPQEVSIPTLSNYKMIAIETDRGTFIKNTILEFLYMSSAVSWSVDDTAITCRAVEMKNNVVYFMSGYVRTLHNNTTQVSNYEFIPVKIYGIKGVSA